MYARLFAFFILALLGGAPFAYAATLYEQSDASGEIASEQPNFQDTFIISDSLGALTLGKDALTLGFSMQDPNAGTAPATAPEGVAIIVCDGGQRLQTYLFTDADRAALATAGSEDFHDFTVTTGTTSLALADGSNDICIEFFGLSQLEGSTRLTSNAAGTIPALTITGEVVPEEEPEFPEGTTIIYEQEDESGTMSNPQADDLTGSINSDSISDVPVGQGTVYLKFRLKDPNASTEFSTPEGVCLQPAGTTDCSTRLQTYFFTDDDRTLLADQGFHWFMVAAATTTETYAASSTEPISIGFFGLSQVQNGTQVKANAAGTLPYLFMAAYVAEDSDESSTTTPESEEDGNGGGGGSGGGPTRTFTHKEQEAAARKAEPEVEPMPEPEPEVAWTPAPIAQAEPQQPPAPPVQPPAPSSSEPAPPPVEEEPEFVEEEVQQSQETPVTPTASPWSWLVNWWWLWLLLLALLSFLLYRPRPRHKQAKPHEPRS